MVVMKRQNLQSASDERMPGKEISLSENLIANKCANGQLEAGGLLAKAGTLSKMNIR